MNKDLDWFLWCLIGFISFPLLTWLGTWFFGWLAERAARNK